MFKLVITLILSLLFTAIYVSAQIPCDDAYGAHCPEESGWDVGECLKKQDDLSPECTNYIEINDVCRDDILANCAGKEYTPDLIVCLGEWTSPDKLSSECLDMLPKKEVKETRKQSIAEKKKADARRRIRNNAARRARSGSSKSGSSTSGSSTTDEDL